MQGYLPVHKERCVSYQDLHRPAVPSQPPREEDSAPAPPAAAKSEREHEITPIVAAERPARRRAVRRTEPMDMEERMMVAPTRSHDPNVDYDRQSGLTSQQIERLRESIYDEEVELECICAERVKPGQRIKTLACGHVFHTKCITRALFNSSKCPFDDIEAL